MNEHFVLSIDQGTTGTTALIINRKGEVVGRGYSEITQYYPRAGWVEHDPEDIWFKTLSAVKTAISTSGIDNKRICAIGITNQRETTIIWDKRTGKPVCNAIVWQCRRTTEICQKLKEQGIEGKVKDKTGLVIDPYFSATKIVWMLQNIQGVRESAIRGEILFGTVDTWLIWKLTDGKVHATDYTNASRTMLFNIKTLRWDDELLEYFEIPRSMLPEVLPSSYNYGKVGGQVGFLRSITIGGNAGDQQSALFGQGCFSKGSIKNTYGTGCFIMLNTGSEPIYSSHGLLTTLACSIGSSPTYAMEGSVFSAGSAVQWLRDGLGIINDASETESIANKVPDSNGVFFVPAFTGLGAPYWDPYARGAIIGVTRGTTREHIVRATLESIAYQTADVLSAMEKDSNLKIDKLMVDGGASRNDLLMQFQSDILGIEVERPKLSDTTALGAAFLAGMTAGLWNSESELLECRQIDRVFKPSMDEKMRAELLRGWHSAVRRVLT